MSVRWQVFRGLAVAVALVGVASGSAAAGAQGQSAACPKLAASGAWYGDNAARLQGVIDAAGTCSGTPGGRRPLAVFDWDNTVIKNDISDQTLFWMLRHDELLQPPRRDWSTQSRYMTRAGAAALRRACGTSAKPGEPLRTSGSSARAVRCADEVLSVREEGETSGGKPVFAGYDHRRMEASYAWMAQLMRGRTPGQSRAIARSARRAALRAPVGATWRVGSEPKTAWIRYYPQIRDLVRTLKAAGFDPWVVSASPEEWADVWGAEIGIDAEHTIGIRTVHRGGRITAHLRGCGPVPDGEDSIMTYIDGKRCAINDRILGIRGAAALQPAPAPLRQVIAGGDADTDVTMVRDATGAHLVLNRNKPELLCRAFANQDGRWVVNPMFIQPFGRFADGYPCATEGATNGAGKQVPVLGDDGVTPIPDQPDRVFAPGATASDAD